MRVSIDLEKLGPNVAVSFEEKESPRGVVVGVIGPDGSSLETFVTPDAVLASVGDLTDDAVNVAKALGVIQ